jgi:hypothetical protein
MSAKFLKAEVLGVLPFLPLAIPQACGDHSFVSTVIQVRGASLVALDREMVYMERPVEPNMGPSTEYTE